MQIRKVDVRQYDQALETAKVLAVAFRYNGGYRDVCSRIEEAKKENKLLADPADSTPVARPWGAYLDDKMIASVTAIDYIMRFEGKDYGMTGIGGVATVPEYRRQGAIRELMRAIFADSLERGHVFSYLYPFSFAYYHQFGYDFGCRRIAARIPFTELRSFRRSGQVRQADAADKAAIQDIYSQFISQTNGAVVRTDSRISRLLDQDPYLEQRWAYIWSDDQGRDRAYILFEKKDDPANPQPGGEILNILDWACSDLDALRGIFSFLNTFSTQYLHVEMRFPLHLPLETLFPEVDPITRTLQTSGQIRILDIRQALTGLSLPAWFPALNCKLAVHDRFLPQNSGLYTLDLQSGQPASVVFRPGETEQSQADLILGVEALSSLVLGCRDLAELAAVSAVEFAQDLKAEKREMLQVFFRQKPACIYDYF